ncbi:MAG: GNAT family N-acetyltransferase [Sphingobacteriales bacterium]|nr:GNAT family N-acetyltransferase [Sphingobacteriales bacterium]MBI3716985.1 GNAT family N-acetyltransferase [Sphingobacteriales bacterium]
MISLRPVEEKDTIFIETVYRSTREAELSLTNWTEQQKQAFIIMQSMAQLADYKKNCPGAVYQIIVYDKKDAGRLYTWETVSEIRIMDISVLPRFQKKGIGTHLMKELIKKSGKRNKKLSLHVEQNNPALKWYERLGFVYIKNNGRHHYMERMPAGNAF